MTRKDLNLSLDNKLIQERADAESARGRVTGITQNMKPGKYAKPTAQASRRNIPALTIAIIAVTNMVFLLLAGLWLSTLPYTHAAPNSPDPSNTTPQMKMMLAETHERLAAVEVQLEQLALALNNRELAAIDRVASEVVTHNNETQKDEQSAPFSAKEIKVPTDNWYVSLGTFTSERAAASLQSRLLALGRHSDIAQRLQGGAEVFELRLSGFGGRELAEMAAGEVMAQTDLNGLSVWQEEQ